MERLNLENYLNGWIVGDFSPSVIRTSEVEVGIKNFLFGEKEPDHYQSLATEVTFVLSGRIRMGSEFLAAGEGLLVRPEEALDFEALEDCLIIAIKFPSLPNDKVLK